MQAKINTQAAKIHGDYGRCLGLEAAAVALVKGFLKRLPVAWGAADWRWHCLRDGPVEFCPAAQCHDRSLAKICCLSPASALPAGAHGGGKCWAV